MKKEAPYHIKTVSEQHRILSLPMPQHPLVSVFNFEDMEYPADEKYRCVTLDLYTISIKKEADQKVKYGQSHYDFDEGVMSFIGPKQVISNISEGHHPKGWCLVFHPDFLGKHPLAAKIKTYDFFGYAANEALHLSEKEEETILTIMQLLRTEINKSIDAYSESVLLSYIDLILSYSDRFYHRQFLTRKALSNDILAKFESLLSAYFSDHHTHQLALPSVQYFCDQLHISPNYLSNMLRSLTGKSTQQHMQDMLIEKSKELLTTTNLTVAEIAYLFGFGYPQSFNKLFKHKTNYTPLAYRKLFN
ncbi:AraC family transcriptional regulator [Chitinophaga sp. sic0106]|uniref:helix-turn-helix domain-containing protein n=1 Tax=Chitinophaga sp. sic0106 TaxID=2854785 RepID=UPI001C48EB2C|nr:AraC family transcriptional regulator [Chitinophaga sp. sic0106]MBV7531591.1 AraC family transcriptional regulator [Chitinophaga sp. sic0106]